MVYLSIWGRRFSRVENMSVICIYHVTWHKVSSKMVLCLNENSDLNWHIHRVFHHCLILVITDYYLYCVKDVKSCHIFSQGSFLNCHTKRKKRAVSQGIDKFTIIVEVFKNTLSNLLNNEIFKKAKTKETCIYHFI